jgi:hypothetical protein
MISWGGWNAQQKGVQPPDYRASRETSPLLKSQWTTVATWTFQIFWTVLKQCKTMTTLPSLKKWSFGSFPRSKVSSAFQRPKPFTLKGMPFFGLPFFPFSQRGSTTLQSFTWGDRPPPLQACLSLVQGSATMAAGVAILMVALSLLFGALFSHFQCRRGRLAACFLVQSLPTSPGHSWPKSMRFIVLYDFFVEFHFFKKYFPSPNDFPS